MCPGWCDCNKQYEYLKAHVQGFEDTVKDPLARRSWNAAFNNQGWEERWALGTTLRKRAGQGVEQSHEALKFLIVVGRVYKQVAYGKVFLMWDLLGFFNSNVIITIQRRWISILASSQAVATVQVGRRAGLHYRPWDELWEAETGLDESRGHLQCKPRLWAV
ncbi:hypothetical protein BDN71DRAFT_1436777 [Pleurotus eryngii]|uniref:Uncharacterized protein n=1 Tax=Pleurotus eryngii TaxID=5323 RepID=A0A9P6D1K3_PLEER|nr:hypothetical protein BDN71DRAFT_1436777 [Pleurotus eryngii]